MNLGWGPGTIGWYVWDEWFPIGAEVFFMVAPEDVVRFVLNTGSGDGSPSHPHGSVEQAVAAAPDDATLIFHAATEYVAASPTLLIDRPLTMKGYDVTIRPPFAAARDRAAQEAAVDGR